MDKIEIELTEAVDIPGKSNAIFEEKHKYLKKISNKKMDFFLNLLKVPKGEIKNGKLERNDTEI